MKVDLDKLPTKSELLEKAKDAKNLTQEKAAAAKAYTQDKISDIKDRLPETPSFVPSLEDILVKPGDPDPRTLIEKPTKKKLIEYVVCFVLGLGLAVLGVKIWLKLTSDFGPKG